MANKNHNSSVKNILEELKNPSAEYTPIPFWFLNDEPNADKLREQLIDFKEKGVDSVILHPRIGIPKDIGYLSKKYFDLIIFIVETAASLSMQIVLYDEGMYPSGSAHGMVVKENASYASIGITLTEKELGVDGEKVLARYPDGKCLIQRPCGGTIRGIHFGEDDGELEAPLAADILNKDAVDTFIHLTHEQYYSHLKSYFGNTIIGFFTDEPSICGRNAGGYFGWTDGLEKEIIKKGGKVEELRALFEYKEVTNNNLSNISSEIYITNYQAIPKENESTILYYQIIRERLNNTYYSRLSSWCAKRGIALMGHPEKSGDIDEEIFFHIPGQDLIMRMVSPEKGGISGNDSVQAKCSADAARHLSRKRNSNECFGVCVRDKIPWYMTASDMKWFIDYLALRGVNLFIPHAFYYSVRGKRSEERPPDVGPNNIWWNHYKLFSNYMKRLSYVMTDSINGAHVAVACRSGDMSWEEVKDLYENQIEFNYLQESLFEQCSVKDKKISIGRYTYDYILDFNKLTERMKWDIPVFTQVRELLSFINTKTDAKDIQLREFLTQGCYPNLRVSHIKKADTDMYLLVNEGQKSLKFTASVLSTSLENEVVLCYDLFNDIITKLAINKNVNENRMHFTIELPVFESRLLIVCSEEEGRIYHNREETMKTLLPMEWKLASENLVNIQKTYTSAYMASKIIGNEAICVEADEMVECYCNDIFIGVSFWNKHVFDVGKYLKNGVNNFKLVITGNIANRYGSSISYGLLS